MMRHNRSNGEEETDHFKTRKNHRIKTEPDKRCEDAVLRYRIYHTFNILSNCILFSAMKT